MNIKRGIDAKNENKELFMELFKADRESEIVDILMKHGIWKIESMVEKQ